MALGWVPMKQNVKIHKQSSSKVDKWGMPIHEETTIDVKARIDSNYTKKTVSFGTGEDVVYTATILFKGLVDVRDSDLLEWVDDFGKVLKKKPLDVVTLNDLSGKVVMTKVVV